jgi:hypothetical protein
MRSFARTGLLVATLGALLSTDVHSQATIFQHLALREIVTKLPIAGRDGVISFYIFPGSPYPFGNLGAGFDISSVCAPQTGHPEGIGVWLSAGRGFGDMVAFTPGGSPFPAGMADPSGRTELCSPLDTDDTWWFAYGDSLNNSPVLAGRFFGQDDELQIPFCNIIQTPEEGIVFLERRSKDRQLYDISCENRDPRFTLRIGTALVCSFKNTWLDPAGNNIQPILEKCERYLACGNTTFGENVPRGGLCNQPSTPPQAPPTNPPVVQCSTQQLAGRDTPETRLVELAKTSGTFQFDFNTQTQKDRIIVSYEGKTLLDTGCVGTAATHFLNYLGNDTRVSVEVVPNCEGGSGTQWAWTTHCP